MSKTAEQFLTDLRRLRGELDGMERRMADLASGARLNALDIQALELVLETPGLRSGRLAAALSVVPTTASSTVTRLRQRGLLSVRPDPADRRAVTLWLTPDGRRVSETLREETLARVDAALAHLRSDERERLISLFARVARVSEASA